MNYRTYRHMVAEFHRVFDHPIAEFPNHLSDARGEFRVGFIEEEAKELRQAWEKRDLRGIADALGDLIYVVEGMALEYGIDLYAVVEEIHRSNMTKLGADGKPIFRHDGKALKGPNYQPPYLDGILMRRLHVREDDDMDKFVGRRSIDDEIAGKRMVDYEANRADFVRRMNAAKDTDWFEAATRAEKDPQS